MKKKVLVKGACSVVFVAAAGIFYLCAAKPSAEDAQIILRNEEEKQEAEGKNAEDTKKNEVLGEETQSAQELIYVHICGAVNMPGVYTLPAGSRIADVVLCAGDFSPDAAKDYLNLAKPVLDGQKIYVPDKEEAEQILKEENFDMPGSEELPYLEELNHVNLNTAGREELIKLPGIGQTKADAILAYRKEHGMFSSCEELMQVPGIKQSVYEKIRDNITVGN